MMRTRPDVLWTSPILSHGVTLSALAEMLSTTTELRQTVISTDDINLIAPRGAWNAVSSLRPGRLRCHRICFDYPFWKWMYGIRTHCLMKVEAMPTSKDSPTLST